MIEKLYIKNYLIIKEAEIEFINGLNILTGETGAGKSIILDALSMILGERADFSLLRKDAGKLIIEGMFNFKGNRNVEGFLKKHELDDNGGYVIIRRELNTKGVSRNFINDTPINLSDLKEFGDLIIDIHSQNDHQSLLRKEAHISILDGFIGENKIKSEYVSGYEIYKELVEKYDELIQKRELLNEKKDVLEFQLKEINNVNPQPGEESELENELKKLENVEDISLSVDNVLRILYEEESAVYPSLSQALKEIKNAAKYDSDFEKMSDDLNSTYISIKEISNYLNNYKSSINFDPVRIEQIRERLGSLNFLKKKYNLTADELIKKSKDLTNELNLTDNYDYELDKLAKKVRETKKKLYDIGVQLTALRMKKAKELEKEVNRYLNEVGLESAGLKIDFGHYTSNEENNFSYKIKEGNVTLTRKGLDNVEFLIKVNKGSDYTPLRKTASGGEISRVMLAIKASVSSVDNVPILVFDEIDAGISGRIAGKVGKVMKELAKTHQIISITHLPQIAALSQRHFYVEKSDLKDETIAKIKILNEEEKITEVAKLISGESVTAAAEKSARELIEG